MKDVIHRFTGMVEVVSIVDPNLLSDGDKQVAQQKDFHIEVSLFDTADYDEESGESIEEWALLNEFHETVAIECLDHFNIIARPISHSEEGVK